MKIKFKKYLKKNKIDFRESFPPIHLQPLYKKITKKKLKLPKSIHTFNRFIDLPIWSNMSDLQVDYIIKKVKNFFNQ